VKLLPVPVPLVTAPVMVGTEYAVTSTVVFVEAVRPRLSVTVRASPYVPAAVNGPIDTVVEEVPLAVYTTEPFGAVTANVKDSVAEAAAVAVMLTPKVVLFVRLYDPKPLIRVTLRPAVGLYVDELGTVTVMLVLLVPIEVAYVLSVNASSTMVNAPVLPVVI